MGSSIQIQKPSNRVVFVLQGYNFSMYDLVTLYATHIYFLAATLFSVAWLLLFQLIPKAQRKEMILWSLPTIVLGYFVEQMHLTDWWQPIFLFDTAIKLEDVLLGFSVGGIVYVLYWLYCRRLRMNPQLSILLIVKGVAVTGSIVTLFVLFYVLHMHSFWASIISLAIPIAIVGLYNGRLLVPIVLTSITLTAAAFLGYQLSIYLNPQFVAETYLLSKLSGILVLGIPAEELVWFFFAAMGGAAFLSIIGAYSRK